MASAYLSVNAWREIFARVFDDPDLQSNVSPDWLINPATRRRLKLDYLCQSVGVAVRFAGLTGKGRRRRGDWELLEQEQGIPASKFDRVRAPIGIDIGAITPAEIAVCIMAEIICVLREGPLPGLSEQIQQERIERRNRAEERLRAVKGERQGAGR